jgi:hypothetical protein
MVSRVRVLCWLPVNAGAAAGVNVERSQGAVA